MNLTSKSNSVSAILAYAPTETAPLEDKVPFWTQLGEIVKTIPKKDQLFLLMDANARTALPDGKVGVERKRVLGPFGRDAENDNDGRLLGLAEEEQLSIVHTFYGHRGDNSATYRSLSVIS